MALNIADLFEHAVDVVPDRGIIQVADRIVSYADLEADANRLAHFLQSRGVAPGDHVGIYAKNSVEHVVALLAIFKIRAVVINVNYRYVEGELDYIFDNSDLVALLHERPYAPLVASTAPKHAGLQTVVAIPDPTEPASTADISAYGGIEWDDALAGQSAERDFGPRSEDDLYIVYTGGTTGFPKGVMWRQADFWRVLGGGIDFMSGNRLEEHDQSKSAASSEPMVTFPLSPLMHGGAQAAMLMHLFAGHRTILAPKFDAAEVWRTIEDNGVQLIFMTGDAMARPLIEEYERGDYKADTLIAVASSAAIFSRPVKERWMKAFPNTFFTDSVGSSETGFQGTGLQDSENIKGEGPQIALGLESVILDEDNRVLDPETSVGQIGRLARTGSVPIGYYKDEAKSAKTFITVDGVRYSVPGDFARIEEGNKVTLLGRGSNCINTGGEKVYPEEVEMALKGHPDVYDVLVVGVADESYGQSVSAVVQAREGTQPTLEGLREFLRGQLSGYKLPRSVSFVDEIPRSATGKANYPRAKELALAALEARV
ncbi:MULTISPECIES: acyl-CoA synthetase [Nocardioides]|uniref:acyl-CoA synthetase n=1 Tax=Nocardioides TaxID=1839 RepID=UPI00032DA8EF|nr:MULTISPECIES: acyl-CoA synthetase [Nocardioides]EON23842.1 acyl-CoA synthetase [Nocardioides sp. CF8]